MSDVETTGLDVIEPAGTNPLDDAINAAFDSQQAAQPDQNADAAAARDERGRFAQKDTNSTDKAPDKGTAEPVIAEAKTTDAQPAPQVQPIEAPARWTEAQKAEFSKLPPETQKIVADRYKEMEADYTRKTQETAEFRKSAEPLLQAVQPYQQYLSQIGLTPAQAFSTLIQAEYSLRTGTPEQKAQALSKIATDYGLDFAALSRGEVAQVDPLLHQLRQQNTTLEQRLAQIEQRNQQDALSNINQQITVFSSAKDDQGRPKYPHFERVRGVMGQLMGSGQAATLEDAYQAATAPINEAVAAELSSRQANAEQMRQSELAKADKVKTVKGNGVAPNGSAKALGLDAILSGALDQAGI